MKKRLVTSALPYVNNIPHLGNCIQVLSADVFARASRMRGYETLYVCGTDEYGTATETKAREEGVSPRDLCDRYNAIHREIYDWFGISFDHFGRTSCQDQTTIVQDMFRKVHEAGYITEHTIEQLYSEASDMFLADRFVRGTCPACGYDDARGDQCEHCGKLLDPTDLINPRSAIDGTVPVVRATRHLYIDLPRLKDRLEIWMKEASVKGRWAKNAIQMTQAWIRDGLKERAITRDLKWGIPVPLEGYEKKVFYVWFDAPIGYISITAEKTPAWKDWWQNQKDVELFQFIGKDNIPFHTVIFPCTLLASGEPWTMLHHMSSTEYLNYEGGKFSKSKGIGVFGTDVKETGIPADVWRFYIFWNRPETTDYVFTWKDFQEKVNKELIGNLGNLINRTLTFWRKNFGDQLPAPGADRPESAAFWDTVRDYERKIGELYDWADLRDALRTTFELSAFGNKVFQDSEPWKLVSTDPAAAKAILTDLVWLVRDLAILVAPVMPSISAEVLAFFGHGKDFAAWKNLGQPGALAGSSSLAEPKILFVKLENDQITALRERYSGSQSERKARDEGAAPGAPAGGSAGTPAKAAAPVPAKIELAPDATVEERFRARIELRVAKITAIEKHPSAEKLYVEKLDDGSGVERTVVSGLVAHYREEELLGRHVILAANLKPAKLRGVMSQGMILAASDKAGPEGAERVEVIFAPDAKPGDQVVLEGQVAPGALATIDIDTFFSIPLRMAGGQAMAGESRLLAAGKALTTATVVNGEVG